MRAVVQRVQRGCVSVGGETIGRIAKGLVVLLGVGASDNEEDARYMVDKIVNLRIFEDKAGKMNLSLLDIQGEALVVSQFTLYGDVRKGRRPGFTDAAPPAKANALYERVVQGIQELGVHTEKGRFQAEMLVEIYNDGPVTILLDSKRQF